MNNTFFITGTDTGIGKTFVTCILMQFIKFHHKKVIGTKPIAAGVGIKKGETANEDVNLLKYESSLKLKVGEINTYSFDEPIAPHIAAQKYNIEIDFKKIKTHAATLKSRTDYLLIEGAGGYLVPLGKSTSIADLVDELNIPIIASGGAGNMTHFKDVFTEGKADAALAASIFHFKEIPIPDLKEYLKKQGIAIRL